MKNYRPSPQQTRLHFVGIGGIGMSGIAELFANDGYQVSGSDRALSELTRRLESLGIKIYEGHEATHVKNAQVVIISSAIRPDNPEVIEAKKMGIPVIPRAEMLGELMRGKIAIAVAGTHGKTTTTSMLGMVLMHAGVDPALVVGGRVDHFGGNAKKGGGELVVAEADESDGSFLHLPATFGIVTNIDNDHLDHFGTIEHVEEAFVNFVNHLPFYGLAVVCGDDPGIKRCLSRFSKPIVTYGCSAEVDFRAENIVLDSLGSRFEVVKNIAGKLKSENLGEIKLHVPGRHNVLNALSVVALCQRLEIPMSQVLEGLDRFSGVKRRFEIWYQDLIRKISIIEDYAHHPTEIRATLEAAKGFWKGRVVAVFQPHRYTRTRDCHEGFTRAFEHADRVLMTEIYSAGEDPLPGISGQALAQWVGNYHKSVQYVGPLENAFENILREIKPGDLCICLGAGSITRLPLKLKQSLEKRE